MTIDSNKDEDDLALPFFIAIRRLDYKQIEKLVERGRDKGLLHLRDKEGNTFIHLVSKLVEEFLHHEMEIPNIDDSSPLIQDVINMSHVIIRWITCS